MTTEHVLTATAPVDTPPLPVSPLDPSRHAVRKRALLGLGAGAYWWWVGQWQASMSDAYVGGNLVQVTALTSGTVKAVLTTETQRVSLGQPLVELDGADAQAALAASEAALAKMVRAVRGQFAAPPRPQRACVSATPTFRVRKPALKRLGTSFYAQRATSHGRPRWRSAASYPIRPSWHSVKPITPGIGVG